MAHVTDTSGRTRKGLLKLAIAQNDALLAGQRHLSAQLTSLEETLIMALNAQGQAIVDALNASTNKVAGAITNATQAITDLFNEKQGAITLADVQSNLDALDSAAEALNTLATTDDPAITPSAPPVVVTTPEGETPVSG